MTNNEKYEPMNYLFRFEAEQRIPYMSASWAVTLSDAQKSARVIMEMLDYSSCEIWYFHGLQLIAKIENK